MNEVQNSQVVHPASPTIYQSGGQADYDLVVVSAFGRGNWLANEFASRGWRVELLDATSQLGKFNTHDVEGPFGLLEGQDLQPSQRARLADEGEFHPVASGFTLWPPAGPLELRSEVTPFHLRAREIPYEVESYLRLPDQSTKEAGRDRSGLRKLQYNHSWLAQFAHALTSAAHHENYVALESESVAPLFTPYGLRQLTSQGSAKGLQTSQSLGVVVHSDVEITDFKLEGKTAATVSYRDANNSETTERARAFVWCFSFEETKRLSDLLARALFPHGWPEAPWGWQRISFDANPSDLLAMIPLSVAVIDDVDLAWTRANLIVLRRREGSPRFDAWMKVPTWMKREPASFAQVRHEVKVNLEKRFPGVGLADVAEEMTPLLWPMWSKEEFADIQGKLAPLKAANIFFSAPGVWTSLDWLGRFRHERGIALLLEKLKTQWDAAARKLEAAAQRRRARS